MLTIKTNVNRALRLAGNSRDVYVRATVDVVPGSVIYKRIERFLLKGILTHGAGVALIYELYGPEKLSYIDVFTRIRRLGVGEDRRVARPWIICGYNTDLRIKEWAAKYNELDRSKWSLLGGTANSLPYGVSNGVQSGYGINEKWRLYLSGATTKASLLKEIEKAVMTPERLARGQALMEILKRNPRIEIIGG